MSEPVETTMPEWLRQRARLTPDRLALLTDKESLTFAELDAQVEAVADRLDEAGVQSGAMVGMLAGNGAGFVKVVHAVARLGAVLAPLNVRLSRDEIAWQLGDLGAQILIHDEANAAALSTILERSSETGPRLLSLEALSNLGAPSRPSSASGRAEQDPSRAPSTELRTGPGRAERGAGSGQRRGFDDARDRYGVERFDLSAVQAVVYTSGTTGRPKGALLTFGNHFWSATGSMLNLGLLPEDRWLACLPLFHVGGLSILFRSVLYGIPAVVHESFDAGRVNRAIEDDGVTIVSVVSVMLERMLDARSHAPYPAHFRCALLGGGPAPRALLERCAAAGVPVVQTYGLTETASQLSTLAPEDALRKLGSAGKPLFPNEVRIERGNGETCAPGEPGEIVARGPSITPGYLNRPDESAAALRDGWLHTGDIGYLDGDGYLYVLDRRDDLIISGGENVYPAEVEGVLQSHPAVVEAGVIGIEDLAWGRRPCAVVVVDEERPVTDAELAAYCRERLAAFKVPARFVLRAHALPRNAAGKLQRNVLREQIGHDEGPPPESFAG